MSTATHGTDRRRARHSVALMFGTAGAPPAHDHETGGTPAVRIREERHGVARSQQRQLLLHVAFIAVCIATLFPMVWTPRTAFAPSQDVFRATRCRFGPTMRHWATSPPPSGFIRSVLSR